MNQHDITPEELWLRQQISSQDVDYNLWNEKRESIREFARISGSCIFTVFSIRQDKRLSQVETKIHHLEAQVTTRPDYFTVAGYGTLNKISVNIKQASSIGRKASQICKSRGIETDKIPDPRFGEVKTYPREVLEEVFNQNIN